MASFVQYNDPINTDFYQTINRFSHNTVVFENHCTINPYVKKDNKVFRTTDLNLHYYEDLIINKYLLRLRKKAINRALSEENRINYDLNPFLCAKEQLDCVDYWWLILLVNDKLSIHEFTQLGSVIKIPDMSDLKNLLKQEMAKNKEFGAIVE